MNRIKLSSIGVVMALSMTLGLMGPNVALAATAPSLGDAATYGIVSSTFTNSLNAGLETKIVGDVCYTTPPATAPISISGATVVPCPPAVGTAQSAAVTNLLSQACVSQGTNVVLSGTYTPGCYSSSGTMDIALSTTVTLDGPGVYIFRSGGALTTGANSKVVLINGASANDVFWVPGGATTIGANSSTQATPSFVGNIMQNALNPFDVTLGHFVNLNGRVLAFGRTVTTDSVTITVPTTLRVVKQVVNDNGGTATAASFNLHVKLGGVEVTGSPAAGTAVGTSYSLAAGTYVVSEDANAAYTQAFSGDCDATGNVTLAAGENLTCTITNNDIAAGGSSHPSTVNVVKRVINDNGRTKTIADFQLFVDGTLVVSGETNTFASIPGVYTVTETEDPNYTQIFSGDCDANGQFNLTPGQNKFCIVTNDDIGAPVVVPPVPPLIDVIKVPSPLSLPTGPGAVTYTYTLSNIGTVPVTNVTMVGDTCSPISLVSGDTNSDAKLDVDETWTYHCYANLLETHTNTIVATGWANGLTATDIASATVVVGTPVVPPLIHITKIPNPLTLLAGGGNVTYTKRVTNPGTVALSNVSITDDKCTPTYVSGDTNGDSKLDTSETWTYTCTKNITATTTNTAVATGEANGMTARDFAIATVVVAAAVPTLPKTGFAPASGVLALGVVAAGIIAVSLLLYAWRKKQAM